MAGQLRAASAAKSVLQKHVTALQKQLHEAGMQPCDANAADSATPRAAGAHSCSRTLSRDGDGDGDGSDLARCSSGPSRLLRFCSAWARLQKRAAEISIDEMGCDCSDAHWQACTQNMFQMLRRSLTDLCQFSKTCMFPEPF